MSVAGFDLEFCTIRHLLACHRGIWPPTVSSVYSWIDLVCDILFLLDLFINFLTARWIIRKHGREEWSLVSDLYTLRQMYMFRIEEGHILPQFWVDFAGIIPWQYADCITQDAGNIRLFRIIRLIKLSRLYRLARLLEQVCLGSIK